MGKASKWFSKLFNLNNRRHHRRHKQLPHSTAASSDGGGYGHADVAHEYNKHSVAVAAATAAVAEAALAAAQAAAEVVRLTAATGVEPMPELHVSKRSSVQDFAAVKIQSAFRGYLARRALKALKGLVKLQAIVRGHLVRKQSADMLRRLQALVRAQIRARTNRALTSHSERESSTRYEPQSIIGTPNPEDASALKRCISSSSIRSDARGRSNPQLAKHWLDNWVEASDPATTTSTSMRLPQNEDKILEIDCCKTHFSNPQPQRITVQDYYNHSFTSSDYLAKHACDDLNVQKPAANWDVTSLKSVGYARTSPMTPMRDEWSKSYLGGYSSPSYMAYTESSRAKSRSQSVPKQRGEFDRRGFSKRSVRAFWDARSSSRMSMVSSINLSK